MRLLLVLLLLASSAAAQNGTQPPGDGTGDGMASGTDDPAGRDGGGAPSWLQRQTQVGVSVAAVLVLLAVFVAVARR